MSDLDKELLPLQKEFLKSNKKLEFFEKKSQKRDKKLKKLRKFSANEMQIKEIWFEEFMEVKYE